MLYIILVAVVLWYLYRKYTSTYDVWKKRGFPYIPAKFPAGLNSGIAFGTRYLGYSADEAYQKAESNPYIGFYDARKPTILLKDPEIIRFVLTKDFSHFRDRLDFPVPEKEYLLHHLFVLNGDKWRALRVKITPTFTSAKMKGMYQLFVNCAEALNSLLLSKIDSSVDVKDVFARFGTDVICSCAFGIDVDSINHSDNELRKIGISIFQVKTEELVLNAFFKIFPTSLKIWQMFNRRFIPKHTEDFIMKLISDTIEMRNKNNIKRNDFLDLMLELRGKELQADFNDIQDGEESAPNTIEMTTELIAAQCFVFFSAGFETSSSVQTYCLYELALHPEMQERLHEEIMSVISKHGGMTYQAVQDMEYLEMVVSETLRKYPTLSVLTRVCIKDFTMPDGRKFEKGDPIVIPLWSLHHDPNHFPNPESFDPERFAPENLSSIKPYTYMPFGEGPRMCIGMRFGQLQVKTGLITLLRNYRVEPSKETPSTLTYIGGSLFTISKETIYLKLLKRDSTNIK